MILAVCPNPSVDTYLYMDTFRIKESSRVINKERFAGGKGIHIALAAAEMGEDVSLLAFWGGETGKWLRKQCEHRNIRCIGPELEEDNRSCFTIKTNIESDDTEILEAGPQISFGDFKKFIHTFEEETKRADVISMSGSWPPGAPGFAYAELIKMCKNAAKPHILDAGGKQMQLAMEEKPYGIHINTAEAQELFGTSNFHEVFAQIPNEIKVVALTTGKDGLFLKKEEALLHAGVQIKSVYSAVGSGDCLTAGISLAMKNNDTAEEIAKLGAACGAANCLRPDLGMLYRRDVERLKKEVKIINL